MSSAPNTVLNPIPKCCHEFAWFGIVINLTRKEGQTRILCMKFVCIKIDDLPTVNLCKVQIAMLGLASSMNVFRYNTSNPPRIT